ncbi:MAG: hypothetical protein KZQ88_17430 [Candidatus Thiodiazotropha sp. (ex Dulcina madagascariensis)]|nr:hypothetical protein [Candidatus Thiodiazotropha sp. (ex Dulcina madagascariensis)]MCU7928170.1 hypothetical protein [Candidatus Thiodiazotropha sp. (ex Dulcina madagascariensis)]
MPDSLSVTMLPAKEGDCLVVAYGPNDARKYILIDGGRAWTYKNALQQYLADHGIQELELLVVTHVDRDHIDGVLSLMQDGTLDLKVKYVWFNTWDHLIGNTIEVVQQEEDELESFGAKMGEELSPLIVQKGWPWNHQFAGAAVALAEQPHDNVIELEELKLTLLSPNREKLDELKPEWKKQCEKAGITPGAVLEEYVLDEDDDLESFGVIDIEALAAEAFVDDQSKANGSSIALILEYDGHKLLLAGDAHAGLLESQLRAHGATADAPLRIDAFKISHHGSKYNVSRELLELLDCKNFLVSTNGNYFKHPDDVAMARLIKFGTPDSTIHFNYKTDHNDHWHNQAWEQQYRYQVEFPETGSDGYEVVNF